jgi:hypothetical protein
MDVGAKGVGSRVFETNELPNLLDRVGLLFGVERQRGRRWRMLRIFRAGVRAPVIDSDAKLFATEIDPFNLALILRKTAG